MMVATVFAILLHGLVWQAWRSRPTFVPAQIVPSVEVALISQPKPVVQPKPQPKPKPLPKPVPLKKAESAPKPEPVAEQPPPAAAPAPVAPAPFQVANYRAAYLQNPPPRYPPTARERHWQGEVLIRTHILADGSAGEVRVERSSGHEILDESALDAIKRWRFIAAKEGDKPVASTVIIPIEFKLNN